MLKLFLLDGLLYILGALHHHLTQTGEDALHIKIILLQGRWFCSGLGLASPLNEFLTVHDQLLLQMLDPLILNKTFVVLKQTWTTIRFSAPMLELKSLLLIFEELVEHFPDDCRRGVLIDLKIANFDVCAPSCGSFDIQLSVPCPQISLLLVHWTSSSSPSLLDSFGR